MTVNSPLGKYAPIVAAFTSVGTIFAFILAVMLQKTLDITQTDVNNLKDIALIALGAVFGGAVGVNGWKREVAAIHERLDKDGQPPAGLIDPKI